MNTNNLLDKIYDLADEIRDGLDTFNTMERAKQIQDLCCSIKETIGD